MNPDQDAPRTSIEMLLVILVECSPPKSNRELALDLNASRSIICRQLKKEREHEQVGYLGSHIHLDESVTTFFFLGR